MSLFQPDDGVSNTCSGLILKPLLINTLLQTDVRKPVTFLMQKDEFMCE